jgi:two-component system, OmpR family, sensor kinase
VSTRRSLRRRVVLLALSVVVVVAVAVDVLLTVSIREEFDREVTRAMEARVALVERIEEGRTDTALRDELAARGVPARLVTPDGRALVAAPDGDLPSPPYATTELELADGGRVTVLVGRQGAEAAQRRVLLIGVGGTVLALSVAGLVVAFSTSRLLRPLDEVVATAREIARGRTGARLGDSVEPEGELGRLAAAFDEMLDAQEAALAAARTEEARSRRFLADAAHQLRTPVAGLRAASEALLHDPGTADRDRLLAHLARESSRTGRLLDALLRVAEQDRGDPPSRRSVDVVALVRTEVERQRPLAPRLTFEVTGSDAHLQTLDEDGLREAVANLLDNARRHARSRIEVAVAPTSTALVLRVVDDGPGVPPGEEERVFERFVSLDDRGGAGLGLSIARATARAQGGDLRVAGGGFELRLPLEPSDDPALSP